MASLKVEHVDGAGGYLYTLSAACTGLVIMACGDLVFSPFVALFHHDYRSWLQDWKMSFPQESWILDAVD